jgi:ubiquinone/menaquinone biosynthesis C-methylase UbiE
MSRAEHWQGVYESKPADELTWYQPHLERSLAFIRSSKLTRDTHVVDVGGGASTLVDDLLDEGFTRLTVIDVADTALQATRDRLGPRADSVNWLVGDATGPLLPERSVDFWHDRAVFHFLTDEGDRTAYLTQLMRCVKPGGRVLIATFAPDGPEKCSGLAVVRYDADTILALLGGDFEKLGEANEAHVTPWGGTQTFSYGFYRRIR